MLILADTNVLLRLSEPSDSEYGVVRAAVDSVVSNGDRLCYVPQNLVEFWNVCTRPADRNGFDLSNAEADLRAQIIESHFHLLPDNERVHLEWRRLVIEYGVRGVQVHDARLVAAMLVHGVTNILTLDDHDFARYSGVSAIHPKSLARLGD